MAVNELGEKTVKCIAKADRLFYYSRMVSRGEKFDCDERTAQAFARTGAVEIVQERPSFKKEEQSAKVDPVVAAVLDSGEVKPPQQARAESTGNPSTAPEVPAAGEHPPVDDAAAEKKPDAAAEAKKPTPAAQMASKAPSAPAPRYDRRDLRAKP